MTEQYRIGELAQRAQVTKRTIHYYINKGLLPPARGAGVKSYYTDEHLYRVLLIKKFQDKYLPLERIKDIITSLSLEEVKEILERAEPAREPEGDLLKEGFMTSYMFKPQGEELKGVADFVGEEEDYFEEGLEYIRVELGLGLELHYPKSLEKERPGMIKALISYGKKIIEEE